MFWSLGERGVVFGGGEGDVVKVGLLLIFRVKGLVES